jgi:hypothetical protein
MRRLLFALLVFSLSCDGSSSGTGNMAACGAFTPCGGSLVGTWKSTGFCSDITSATSGSCTMTMDTSNFHPSGTFTFSSDGTYSSVGTVSGTLNVNYTQGCFSGMTTMSCPGLSSAASSTDAGVTLNCTSGTAGDCQCTETLPGTTTTEQGTYTTSGASLATTQTSSTSTPSTSDYCVQGNTLKLRTTSSNTGAVVNGSSILVLAKQ